MAQSPLEELRKKTPTHQIGGRPSLANEVETIADKPTTPTPPPSGGNGKTSKAAPANGGTQGSQGGGAGTNSMSLMQTTSHKASGKP